MYLLYVKKFREDAVLPTRAVGDDGAVGYDLTLIQDDVVGGFSVKNPKLIPLGIGIEMPYGWAGKIGLRGSGGARGLILFNAEGLLDPSYRGELKLLLGTTGARRVAIYKGESIAQIHFVRVELPEFEWAEELTPTMRGSGAFGSTGVGPAVSKKALYSSFERGIVRRRNTDGR